MNIRKKPRIGLVFGGPSMESSISCISAQAIWQQIDQEHFSPVALAWSKNRNFYASNDIKELILHPNDPNRANIDCSGTPQNISDLELDLIFSIVHGHGGEDGVLQGFFQTIGLKVLGAGVLGSAICFHKDICKRVLQSHDLPVVPWVTVSRGKPFPANMDIAFPVFVKPAASGSSVAVSKVNCAEDLIEAMETAFVECKDILIEQGLKARELECAYLLGKASGIGEITTSHEFYSWEAKYVDPHGAQIILKAQLPDNIKERIRELTIKACEALKVEDFARVDFFYDEEAAKVYINEINTLPGFTSISMFPQLWEEEGISFKEQISKLINSVLPK